MQACPQKQGNRSFEEYAESVRRWPKHGYIVVRTAALINWLFRPATHAWANVGRIPHTLRKTELFSQKLIDQFPFEKKVVNKFDVWMQACPQKQGCDGVCANSRAGPRKPDIKVIA
jgi:hypothetical protein